MGGEGSQSDTQWTHNQTHNRTQNQTHNGPTTDSEGTHNGLTKDSQRIHNGLTIGLTMDSQWTHNGLTKDSQRTHTKIIEKALVLLGCPRKRLFLHWFYKVVREKCCFYNSFIRLSAKHVVFTLVLQGLSAKNLIKPYPNQDFSWTTCRARFRRTHNGLTMDSQRTHNGLTMDSQWTHKGLTTDSQWTHNRLTTDSQWTHNGFTMDSHQNH